MAMCLSVRWKKDRILQFRLVLFSGRRSKNRNYQKVCGAKTGVFSYHTFIPTHLITFCSLTVEMIIEQKTNENSSLKEEY